MDLDVAAIAQTPPVGTLDLDQILASNAYAHAHACSTMRQHVASVGVQAIPNVVGTEIHPDRFFVAAHVPVRFPRVLGARVGAAVLVAGVGIDSQPLARFVSVILGGMAIISIHSIRCCNRGLFRHHLPVLLLLLPPLLMMSQPVEVLQIRLGIPKELAEGLVVPSAVHQVLEGVHAPDFGVDDVVLQFEVEGSKLPGGPPVGPGEGDHGQDGLG